MSSSERERRRFVRIDYRTPASLTGPHGTDGVEVVDLSMRGALLRVPSEWEYDSEPLYRLRVDLTGEPLSGSDGGEEDILTMDLRLAHHSTPEPMVGFECQRIDVDSLTLLRELIERHCGDPELVHRDLVQLIADKA